MPERFKFTKTALESLKAPSRGRLTVYDALTPKLGLRVTAAGAKSFYVVRRHGAKMEWLRLGAFPDMTVEKAQKEAAKALGEYAEGQSPVAARRAGKAQPTLAEGFEDYLASRALHGVKTTADMRALWDRCVGTMPNVAKKPRGRPRTKHPAGVDWSARKMDAIEQRDVADLHDAIGATHKTMANRVVELISAVYGFAIERQRLTSNPAAGVRAFKEKKRDRFIQSTELPKFFEALASDTSLDFQHFVLLALLTGARRTNVMMMRWEGVSMDCATWRIPDTKNDDPLFVPLMAEAIEVLKARGPKADGWVFPANSKAGHMTAPKKRWKALLARAGVEDFRIHDLRRSMGSWQAITGASLTIIGKSLGHKSADATMIYSRLSIDPVRASMATATSAMLEAGGLKKPAEVNQLRRKKTAA